MKDAAPFAVLREQASLDCLLCSVFLIGDSLVAICESLAGVTKEELIHVKLDKNEAFLVGPIELVLDYIILKVLNGKQRAANCVSFLQRCNVSSQYAGVASAHLHHVIQVSFVRVCVADNTLEPDGTRIQWGLVRMPNVCPCDNHGNCVLSCSSPPSSSAIPDLSCAGSPSLECQAGTADRGGKVTPW